jgi:hypothetical protein
MALTVDLADRIRNRFPLFDPLDHTALNADIAMAIFDKILNGEYRIKPLKVYATETELLATIGETLEHAGALDTLSVYKWDGSAWVLAGGGSGITEIDGGSANSVYLPIQNVDGGGA